MCYCVCVLLGSMRVFQIHRPLEKALDNCACKIVNSTVRFESNRSNTFGQGVLVLSDMNK